MIPCTDPSAQFLRYQDEIQSAINRVLFSNRYILGTEVAALEEEFSAYIDTPYCVGLANGTDALEIALRSLDIGFGDEVVTVSHTAVATVAAVEAAGATPKMVDIDPLFYTIDPACLQSAITSKTKAVIAVHIYGQPCEIDLISNICKANGIYLIEDVSQAHGSLYKGKKLGSFGDVSCFSCYPTKNLGAIGDAGLLLTPHEGIYQKAKMIREYGWLDRKSMIKGRNSRLDEIQAAILRVKLRYLDESILQRRQISNFYQQNLPCSQLHLPDERPHSYHSFHLYVIKCEMRDDLASFLQKNGIQTGIHYPVPVHSQPAYNSPDYTCGNLTVTESLSKQILSLPMYPELSLDNASLICNAVTHFYLEK